MATSSTVKQTSTPWKKTSDKPTVNDRTSTQSLITTSKAVRTTTGDPCGVDVGQHSSYLKDNLDIVRQKCREFLACSAELYKSENLHRILAGKDLQLRNICGLLYQNISIPNNQCSSRERQSIKELLSEELKEKVTGQGRWRKLTTCFDKTPDEYTYLDQLCRLKGNSSHLLCNETDVHSTTEAFLNKKLRQYNHHCRCKTDLTASRLPLGPLIGGLCGGTLILLLIFIIIVLYVRQEKLKHRLRTKRSGNTTAPNEQFLSFQSGEQTSLNGK